MKILFVINNLGMGGAENMVVRLADSLADKGYTIKIAIFSNPILVRPKNSSIEIINYETVSGKGLLETFLKLRNTIRSFNPDVVHSHMFRANFISRLVRLTLPFSKLICTEHSTSVGGVKKAIAYRITDVLASINTNVSSEAVDSYIRHYAVKAGRMISVPNGIDTEKFKLDEKIRIKSRNELQVSDKNILLAVGRLSPAKNYSNLIHSISYLKKSGKTNFKLFIVGDGPLYEDLNQLRQELGVENLIEFLGLRHDISYLMQAADIYLMSSSWEGLPMVILEAMSCEKLIISTDCGGIANLIRDSGFTVPIDDPKALASQIESALEMTEQERKNRGMKARKHILNNYTLDINTQSYINLYNQSFKK